MGMPRRRPLHRPNRPLAGVTTPRHHPLRLAPGQPEDNHGTPTERSRRRPRGLDLAVRLQLKLGAVTEHDRLPDSPDAIVVVEPSVGSVARTKGNLYVLVTSRVTGNRAREAARLTAETIRNEYYYDESAGIRGCLLKSISLANKRLGHQRDRYGLGHGSDDSGPIGIGVAVVRGNELYVSTVGPTEAYLIRQARLSTLPDSHRDRGLPFSDLEPDVWRGQLLFCDSPGLVC